MSTFTHEQFEEQSARYGNRLSLSKAGRNLLARTLALVQSHTPEAPEPSPSPYLFQGIDDIRTQISAADQLPESVIKEVNAQALRTLSELNALHALDIEGNHHNRNNQHIAHVLGIGGVWAALDLWNKARTAPTAALAETTIDLYPGGAKITLSNAFQKAKEAGIDFDKALDRENGHWEEDARAA